MNTKEENTICPYCKEEIKSDAIKCKHCHSKLKTERPDHGGVCPFCKEDIKSDAVKCKHCNSSLLANEHSDCKCGNSVTAQELIPMMTQQLIDGNLLGSSEGSIESEVFQSRFPSTLPKCRFEPIICGSSLPGYPPITCGVRWVCRLGGQDTIIKSMLFAQ